MQFKMNSGKLAKFIEPVFQLSLASLKCLGILVLSWPVEVLEKNFIFSIETIASLSDSTYFEMVWTLFADLQVNSLTMLQESH